TIAPANVDLLQRGLASHYPLVCTTLVTCAYGPQRASRAQWKSSVTVTLGRLVCLLTISCVNTFIALSGQLCWRQCRLRPLTEVGPHAFSPRPCRRPRKQNVSPPSQ